MDAFEEREKAFEAKYRLEQEVAFKVAYRCARLLGEWAAKNIGMGGGDAQAYARKVQETDLVSPAHQALLHRIAQDMSAAGQKIDEAELKHIFESFMTEARRQVTAELEQGKQRIEPGA